MKNAYSMEKAMPENPAPAAQITTDIYDRNYLSTHKNNLLPPETEWKGKSIIQSSSGTGNGTALLIPRMLNDINDIFRRSVAFYVHSYGTIPQRIAVIGGACRSETTQKMEIQTTYIHQFTLDDLEALMEFNPEVIACYPSIARELMDNHSLKLPALRMLKLSGERLYSADIRRLHRRFSVPILEQYGSVEMPAVAFRLHEHGILNPSFILQEDRYSFLLPEQDGWFALKVFDRFPELLLKIPGYYAMGDEMLMEDGIIIDVRRIGDPANNFFPLVERLFTAGCRNVQIDPDRRIVWYESSISLPSTLTYQNIVYIAESTDSLARYHSDKLPLIVSGTVPEYV